jgi:hypothetical protein
MTRAFLGIVLATAFLGIVFTTAFLGIVLAGAFLGIVLARCYLVLWCTVVFEVRRVVDTRVPTCDTPDARVVGVFNQLVII